MTSPLLRAALRSGLTTAMRARDRQTAGTLRNVLAALDNAEAVPVTSSEALVVTSEHVAGSTNGLGGGEVERRTLLPSDERAVVEAELTELRTSAAALTAAGQHERSEDLLRAAQMVEQVLNGLKP